MSVDHHPCLGHLTTTNLNGRTTERQRFFAEASRVHIRRAGTW